MLDIFALHRTSTSIYGALDVPYDLSNFPTMFKMSRILWLITVFFKKMIE